MAAESTPGTPVAQVETENVTPTKNPHSPVEMKLCPKCGLPRPTRVLTCDCGQDLSQARTPVPKTGPFIQILSGILWLASAVIAIAVVGLFTRGGIGVVVYAIKEFQFTSAPYVASAITMLVVRFLLFILVAWMQYKEVKK